MKEINFVEKKLPEYAKEMFNVTGSGAAPQIVINGRSIGGFDVLSSLELRGELDRLLVKK